jgi:hypothetical protein
LNRVPREGSFSSLGHFAGTHQREARHSAGTSETPENIKMRTSGLIRFMVAATSSPIHFGHGVIEQNQVNWRNGETL